MYFKFGSYQHPDDEVDLIAHTKRGVYSPLGKRRSVISQLQVRVNLKADTQAAINTAIENIEATYLRDLQSGVAGLYHDDDTPTEHILIANQSFNGVQVVSVDYREHLDGEYATGRRVDIVLRAEFPQIESDVMLYQQTVQIVGGDAIEWKMRYYPNRQPQRQNLFRPSRWIIQNGSAVGLRGYILPPGPMFPRFEHPLRRRESTGTALNWFRQEALNFPTAWTYWMEVPPAQVSLGPVATATAQIIGTVGAFSPGYRGMT